MKKLVLAIILSVLPWQLHAKFVYGIDKDYMPFEWIDEAGRPQGFNVELIRLLAAEMDEEVEIVGQEWYASIAGFNSGRLDCISAETHLDGRDQPRFVSKLIQVPHSLTYARLYFKRSRDYINDITQLSGLRVAVQKNSFNAHALTSSKLKITQVVTESENQSLLKLHMGEVDAAIVTSWVGNNFINERPLANIITSGMAYFPRNYGFSFMPHNRGLAIELQQAMHRISASGDLDRLRIKWFRSTSEIQGFDRLETIFYSATIFGVVLVLLFLFWNRILMRSVEKRTAALKAQTRLAEKNARLAILGTVSAGMAHEINNPNGVITQASNGLQKNLLRLIDCLDYQADIASELDFYGLDYQTFRQQSTADLERIIQSSRKIHALVNELKDYARPGNEEHKSNFDVVKVCDTSILLCRSMLKSHGAEIAFSGSENAQIMFGNKMRLEQVLINLIQNAIHACVGKKGKITLKIESKNNVLHIYVADNGCGMSSHTLVNATESFYTTRQGRGGMGLGLAICQRIVKEHHGKMIIESEVDQGTQVKLQFPLASGG